jgi:D-3-phosphoglycerate dehydrogenase / 2-oxoglutarate reductase
VKLLVASPLDPAALARLKETHDVRLAIGASESDLAEAVRDREAIIFRSGVALSTLVLEAGHELRLLVRAGSGLDNLDLDTVARRGIVLERVPGPGAQAVAELTFGLLLGLARQVVIADRAWREGHWIKSKIVGYNLRGKTLGIVGLGSIGSTVARLGRAWDMGVVGCVERFDAARRQEFADAGIQLLPDLDPVLERADFLTIHVPLKPETRNMIGAAELARMKPSAFLVNIARGGVVDESALRDALVDGRLAGAALDVHTAEGEGRISPLADLPNVILTPHIGAGTIDAQREIGEIVVAIVDSFSAAAPRDGLVTAGRTE